MLQNEEIKNLKVDAFTTPSPHCVKVGAPVSQIIDIMEREGIRHVPVEDDSQNIVGIITDRDVSTVRTFAFNHDIQAKDIMSHDPVSVIAGTPLLEAVFLMADKKIGSLIVNDEEGKITGIFTSTDALNALVEILRGDILEME